MLPLLSGHTEIDNSKKVQVALAELEQERDRLKDELRGVRQQLTALENVIAVLRRLLEPQYRALQAVMGEIEIVDVDGASVATGVGSPKQSAYQKYLDQFGGNLQGKMLEAILDHGPRTVDQLRVHMACSKQSVYNAYNRLVKMGLVYSQGGKYYLKEL